MSTLTLSILLGASLAGLGTGTASLLSQSEHYSALREAIDVDTERLETSASTRRTPSPHQLKWFYKTEGDWT